MKHWTQRVIWFLVLVNLVLWANVALSNVPSPDSFSQFSEHYRAAILVDEATGRILYGHNERQATIPASTVKMMVALIVLEQEERGQVNWSDRIQVSRWASKIGGQQVYLKEKEVFRLDELMKAMVISSANDATVSIAEYVGGSQSNFVRYMNQRAQQIGMKDTTFHNPHGLPPGRGQKDNVTTAYDLAILARWVLRYPKYLEWSSTKVDYFRNGTFQLVNTNIKLLRAYPGLDGLKTGYHRKARFNLVATAMQDGDRLISVVMGVENQTARQKATSHLLTHGFETMGKQELGSFLDMDFSDPPDAFSSIELNAPSHLEPRVTFTALPRL